MTVQGIQLHRVFFYLLLAGVLYLNYQLISPFLSIALLSFFVAILVSPVYNFFFRKTGKRSKLSATFSMIVVLVGVLVPFALIVNMIVSQSIEFSKDIRDAIEQENITFDGAIDRVNMSIAKVPFTDFQVTEDEVTSLVLDSVNAIPNFLVENIDNISSGSVTVVLNLVLFFLFLATFIPNQQHIIDFLKRISPLDDEIDDLYIQRVLAMSKSMLEGTFLIAFVQATVTGVVMWIVGVDYVIFWTILMMFFGIIPMFGTGFIAVPIGLFLVLTGSVWQGVTVILFSMIIVSQIDNVLRVTLVPKNAKMHPVLTLIALIGGIRYFGMLGFLYGPILMILLVTTIEIYIKYYHTSDDSGKL